MTFDADAAALLHKLERLLKLVRHLLHLANASMRAASAVGSAVGPRTSGGQPGDPTGEAATAGLKPPGDIAALFRSLDQQLDKWLERASGILQDHLREASTPTEQCKCRGCSDKGVTDGLCQRCFRVSQTTECGPTFHSKWERSRSLRVDRQKLCTCPADECTRPHPDGGCNNHKRPNGSNCEACNKSSYRARQARNGDSP